MRAPVWGARLDGCGSPGCYEPHSQIERLRGYFKRSCAHRLGVSSCSLQSTSVSVTAVGGPRGALSGLEQGHDREERRGGPRDRRGRRDRRDYERERERERMLEDEAVGPFASRFQTLEEMQGQVRIPMAYDDAVHGSADSDAACACSLLHCCHSAVPGQSPLSAHCIQGSIVLRTAGWL